jgi:RNA polymerase sigma-70 factor, ECF subfamily
VLLKYAIAMSSIVLSSNIVEKRRVVSELFKQYYKEMCKAAFQIIRDKSVSEDVVQNVFLKLYKNTDELIIEYPKSYLKRITINEAIDHFRKISKNKNADIDSIEGLSYEIIDDSDRSELYQRVNNSINELPTKCRLIFLMKRKEGYTNQEIADELDISIKTVENQMTKAFKILREKLGVLQMLLIYLFY